MRPEIVDFVRRYRHGAGPTAHAYDPNDDEKDTDRVQNDEITKPFLGEGERHGGKEFYADVAPGVSEHKEGGVDWLGALQGALAGFSGGPDAVLSLAKQRQSVIDTEVDRLMKAKEFAAAQKDKTIQAELERQNKKEIAESSARATAEARGEARQDRQAILEAARVERETTRASAAAVKEAVRQDKLVQDETELNVPGWDRSADVRPTPEEAKLARKGLADFDSFSKGIEQLKGLIRRYGSTNLMGKGSSEAGSLATGLKLTLKNIAQLGVMSESDAELLSQQVINPNEMASLKISTPGAIEQLDSTLDQAKQKMEAGMVAKGYKRAAGVLSAPPPAAGNTGKVKVSNGTETFWIEPEDEASAVKDGYERI